MRILIADDSQPVRRGVIRLLTSEENWEVCGQASNGLEALQKARELRPDLVLLDISMPGADGLETAHFFGQEMPGIKIVIMSHYDPKQLLPRALEAGAHACVDKSRITTDLLATIHNLFNKSQPGSGPSAPESDAFVRG